MSLGETIRTLRSARGMSQNDLAEALDVSRQSISKWETDGAVPELDKLVRMSERFGITLDALVKGECPAEGAEVGQAEPVRTAEGGLKKKHAIPGMILLCLGALIVLLVLFLGGGLGGLLFASPFLLCGAICLATQRHTGLWCVWAVFFCVDAYICYATGITWKIILQTLHFTPEMNFVRLYIGWAIFLWGVLLLALTLRAFRDRAEPWDKKHICIAAVILAALAGVILAQRGILSHLHSLSYDQGRDIWYIIVRFWCDFLALVLLAALLVKGAAFLRWRWKKRGAAAS